jgi:hypothetical protein
MKGDGAQVCGAGHGEAAMLGSVVCYYELIES